MRRDADLAFFLLPFLGISGTSAAFQEKVFTYLACSAKAYLGLCNFHLTRERYVKEGEENHSYCCNLELKRPCQRGIVFL